MARQIERKIAFIGAMGSGKTTVARAYGECTGKSAVDTDSVFTARYGDISAYIASHGESAFRTVERDIVREIAFSDAEIISCGGGVVCDKSSMCALRRNCDIVCLTAPTEVLNDRIRDSFRPFKDKAEALYSERRFLYERYADYTVNTDCADPAERVISALKVPRGNRYDILLCDADDTLLDFQRAMRYAITTAASEIGVRTPANKLIEEFRAASATAWGRFESGSLPRTDIDVTRFSLLSERIGERFDVPRMIASFRRELMTTRYVIDGAREFLTEVRARGIKAYIITNGYAVIARERLKALDGFTDGAFISDDIGYHKPDRRFFDRVLSEVGGEKSRILVVGDGVNSDIEGAIGSGLDSCLYDPTATKSSNADYSVTSYAELSAFI